MLRTLILGIGLIPFIAACTHAPEQPRPMNTLMEERRQLEVYFADGSTAVTAESTLAISQLLEEVPPGAIRRITLEGGHADQAHPQMADALLAERTERVRQLLVNHGYRMPVAVAARPITGAEVVTGQQLLQDHVGMVVDYVRVESPTCPNWSKRSHANYGNTPSSNFGCATMNYMGRMVAYPDDLMGGETGSHPDAYRSTAAVADYRNGTGAAIPEASAAGGN